MLIKGKVGNIVLKIRVVGPRGLEPQKVTAWFSLQSTVIPYFEGFLKNVKI